MALLKVAEGDIVAIPAVKDAKWGFVLSRVVLDNRVITIIEVFSDFHTDFGITEAQVRVQDFSIENRLFSPVYASFDFNKYFGKVKWPVLLHDPNYDKEQSKYSEIEFEYSSEYQEFGRYAKGGKECTEPPGVRRNLQDKTIYSNPQLMHRISLHLNGYLKRGEPMNALRERAAIEQNGMDWWVDGVNACNDIADAIATKFKEAQKKLS